MKMIVPGDTAPEGLDEEELSAWRATTALTVPVLDVAGVCPGDEVDVDEHLVDQLRAQGWEPAAAKRTRKKSTPDAPVEPQEATE